MRDVRVRGFARCVYAEVVIDLASELIVREADDVAKAAESLCVTICVY